MNPSIISASHLVKSYGGRRVVDDLSFTVGRGEVFGLLGHNGAGKTTAIEMLLGLKVPDAGTAAILDKNPRLEKKSLFEKVGVQLQSSAYQAAIRVDELCREYAALYVNPADYRGLLAQFGLSALGKSPVMKLSGGERQKLSVVLALMGNPEVVFLDELTTGLDVAARREVWRTLRHLKEHGLTIFLTTHYMEEAEALCDRICLIKNGKKRAEGTIAEVIAASPFSSLEDAYLWYMDKEDEQ